MGETAEFIVKGVLIMSGASSRARRVEAVKAAEAFAYGRIKAMPDHFDTRQEAIFDKYVGQFANRKSFYDELDNDVWVAYTGMTRTEYIEDVWRNRND